MLETKPIFNGLHKDGFYSPKNFLPFMKNLEEKGLAKLAKDMSREMTLFEIYSIQGTILIYTYQKVLFYDKIYGPLCSLHLTGEIDAIAKAEELIKPK